MKEEKRLQKWTVDEREVENEEHLERKNEEIMKEEKRLQKWTVDEREVENEEHLEKK